MSEKCAKKLENIKGQFITGISPDILLNQTQEKLFMSADNYLKTLLDMYSGDVLMFYIDFEWNISNRDSKELDINQLARLEISFSNDSHIQKILRKNSKKIFKVGKYD